MTRQLISTVRLLPLRSPHAQRPPPDGFVQVRLPDKSAERLAFRKAASRVRRCDNQLRIALDSAACFRRAKDSAGPRRIARSPSFSGTKEKRPELDRLMADAHRRRRFDSVLCWKFDRFARSVSHLLRALETFRSLGIDFISFSEQLDTSTPTGKMVFTVLGAVAELERSLIVERVRAGMRNARAKGKRIGRTGFHIAFAIQLNSKAVLMAS